MSVPCTYYRLKSTADKAPDTNTEVFIFLQDLQAKQRADERTRTAYPCSLRVGCSEVDTDVKIYDSTVARRDYPMDGVLHCGMYCTIGDPMSARDCDPRP